MYLGQNTVLLGVLGMTEIWFYCLETKQRWKLGISNKNPVLDTCIHEVTFPDGHSVKYLANTIAKCLYSQVDSEGNQYIPLDEIIDWKRTSNAVEDSDLLQISHNGNLHHRRTTKWYYLCVRWKDGSTSWEPLTDMKESYPTQVAAFAISQGIHDLPGFKWWVPYSLKRKNRILSAIKTRHKRKSH